MLFVSSFLLVPAALAAPWAAVGNAARSGDSNPAANGVAYFLENDPAGSSIVSLKIGHDGSLSSPIKTATGGRGSFSVNGTGSPDPADTLGSQGAVAVAHDMLFAVNAGSNTLSMFAIDPQDPSCPKLLGSPISTLGDFPVSVAYSEKLKKACVLNGGKRAGVACFSADAYKGLQADGPLRTLPKSVINETTPPSGPPGSASQVLFNPDSTALFATIKGGPVGHQVKLGSLVAWPVAKDGTISTTAPALTQIQGLPMDFGFQFLSNSRIFMADPSFGAALLDVGSNLKATQAVHTVLPGQTAVCWTASEPQLNTVYGIDAGQNVIYTLNTATGALTGNITVHYPPKSGAAPPNNGLFDNAVQNGKMYVLAGTPGVFVIDLASKKTQQYFDASSIGPRQFFQGMAVWP